MRELNFTLFLELHLRGKPREPREELRDGLREEVETELPLRDPRLEDLERLLSEVELGVLDFLPISPSCLSL